MRALISVSDKTGVVEFAKGLRALGWEVIATGGTMKLLRESGVEVINISDVTGFPEICDGRVKTLHPKVHGGLLARRDDPEHLKALKENGIEFIDLVCVNLYPFRQTIAKPDVKMEDAIENIDIGGPSMLRSAAKNWADVTVVCDPMDYEQVLVEIKAGGNTEKATRLKLSAKAYTHTAEYDAMIATYMRKQAGLNEKLFLEFDLVQSLRYGENPHQGAKFYREEHAVPYSLAFARQLNGKELSYNNIQDANAALCIVREFDRPFCVGLKHMNPCGAAVGRDVVEAWTKAYEADKVSIFGGIVATNCTVTREVAELMKPIFLEIIMAPKFDEGALEVLCTKKNLRLLEVDMTKGAVDPKQYVSVNGGLLVQDLDVTTREVTPDMCVTKAKPAAEQMDDLNFGWRIVKHVKSNAIVAVKDGRTLGVGAGQMNRIGSAELALKQARAAGVTEGIVLASDGFFPFDDCVALAAESGVTAIVQPGGSVRDEDSIRKADENGIAMCFTGERHFKH
ncbi:MAG TPA: bifunctional phosphoribosylaminoimidazolecarboxamide formyltransferase/IMP cyclohydrolase [Candidatus Alistipes intestinigallinarum]|uniref:Bifunctional purine biosynthesis protein PurH n=1 Tax=Candidatus Alistipes intestinigallinarum TaxID=2838440 RepID=A0A9D1Z0K4_9BACT|nr:bifunctional phosphoribosylaminoimidazolecarboxamide formyltransferase/IMP cyclohydrolase [Candidatus Alistipes intestinigallinarum]